MYKCRCWINVNAWVFESITYIKTLCFVLFVAVWLEYFDVSAATTKKCQLIGSILLLWLRNWRLRKSHRCHICCWMNWEGTVQQLENNERMRERVQMSFVIAKVNVVCRWWWWRWNVIVNAVRAKKRKTVGGVMDRWLWLKFDQHTHIFIMCDFILSRFQCTSKMFLFISIPIRLTVP